MFRAVKGLVRSGVRVFDTAELVLGRDVLPDRCGWQVFEQCDEQWHMSLSEMDTYIGAVMASDDAEQIWILIIPT